MLQRGRFIVFEGIDRSGKSTQVRLLSKKLANSVVRAFPTREGPIGSLIAQYLSGSLSFEPDTIHLLFSADRRHAMREFEALLDQGIHIVCDRYMYSGIAYSKAKGLDSTWCTLTELGLLEPDVVIYLKADVSTTKTRAGYGEETYETDQFQQRVKNAFDDMALRSKDTWITVESTTVEETHDKIMHLLL
jgi:dTMP kinase